MAKWTDEMDAILGRHLIYGGSAQQAADAINLQFRQAGLTRSAVLGRINRRGRTYLMALARGADPELLGKYREEAPAKLNRNDPERAKAAQRHEVGAMPGVRARQDRRSNPERKPHQWSRKSDSSEQDRNEAQARAERAERRVATAKVADSKPTTFLNLRFDQCKWPLGDVGTPEFRFCGAAREKSGKPYCEFHRKMASGGYVRRLTDDERAMLGRPKSKPSGFMLRAQG